jgi:hypothetical protein
MKRAPFDNCQFQTCDLPGQCASEGQCHHPDTKDQQAVIDNLRTQLADATRKLEEVRKDAEQINPVLVKRTHANDIEITVQVIYQDCEEDIFHPDGYELSFCEGFSEQTRNLRMVFDKDSTQLKFASTIDQAIEQGKGGDDAND